MAWAYACASAIKGRAPIKRRRHGYRYKSWFRLGFDQLRKWILHHPEKAAEVWRQCWPKPKKPLKSIRRRVVCTEQSQPMPNQLNLFE
jgi:hypothetical protein